MSINQSCAKSESVNALSVFETLASSVWDWLGNARRLRLAFSEYTVSDLTALEIARLLPQYVDLPRVTKREELIDRYAHGRFVPVPERIAIFDMRDDWKISHANGKRVT